MEETASRINDMITRSKAELGIPESKPYDIVVSTFICKYLFEKLKIQKDDANFY